VTFYLGERRDVQRVARRLFGRPLHAWEYAGLAGAPDDAHVQVGTYDGGLYVEMADRPPNCCRGVWLMRPRDSQVVIVNDGFQIRSAKLRGRGLGLRMFQRQLEHAKGLRIAWIETVAGRCGNENGYYTWPRFGFDGPLPGEIRRVLPLGLDHAETVLDLMAYEKGRLWWKEQGRPIEVRFDMSPGSRCWNVFSRYVRRKLGLAIQPDVDSTASSCEAACGSAFSAGAASDKPESPSRSDSSTLAMAKTSSRTARSTAGWTSPGC
jgi:GNAT superfamily N-acetyltransferase